MSGNFLSCLKGVRREGGISLVMPQQKNASSRIEGRISWFFLSCGGNLGVPLKLQRGLQGPPRIGSGKSSLHASCEGPLGIPLQLMLGLRSSSAVEAGTSGFLSSADMIFGFLWSFNGGVKPRLLWRHAGPPSSRAVSKYCQASCRVDIGICGFLSRCHWDITRAIVL